MAKRGTLRKSIMFVVVHIAITINIIFIKMGVWQPLKITLPIILPRHEDTIPIILKATNKKIVFNNEYFFKNKV